MNDKISDKDKKDWQNFLNSSDHIYSKDKEDIQKSDIYEKKIDLHGYSLEDANKKIDMAQSEAQKIASKLTSEIETVSKNSGLDMATLLSLVKQFMDQEMQ